MLVFLLIIVAILMFFLSKGGLGCLTSLPGLFLPRRGKAAKDPDPVLQFRVETDGPDRVARDVILVGHQFGLSLGDEVKVTALSGRGLLQALTVTNHRSSQVLCRKGLLGAAVGLAVLVLVVISILPMVLGGGG